MWNAWGKRAACAHAINRAARVGVAITLAYPAFSTLWISAMLKPTFSTSAGGLVSAMLNMVWTADVEVLSECG